MTQFKCGSCQEIQNLSPKSKFCPICGSTSLNLVVKEQAEPAAKETIGVYTRTDDHAEISLGDIFEDNTLEEEDQPSQQSKP